MIAWLEQELSIRMKINHGIIPFDQESQTIDVFAEKIDTLDNFSLCGFSELVPLLGSLVLSFAYLYGFGNKDQIWRLSRIDEEWQEKKWGKTNKRSKLPRAITRIFSWPAFLLICQARVRLWGSDIGAVTWLPDRGIGVFQYTPEFTNSGIEVSPLMMPLRDAPYEFPSLPHKTFKGLPGMLADSLPDKFGNSLIDTWLASQGRKPDSFTPVERLSYTGKRGVGALEFHPSMKGVIGISRKIEIDRLVLLANRVVDDRIALEGKFEGIDDQIAIQNILRVGSSAGGARAKAVLAWNPETGEFRSEELLTEKGFSHWLMKSDGVSNNRDKELADPQEFGRIEYAYHLMARAAGIEMNECRLHEEGGRAHFMTRRLIAQVLERNCICNPWVP